MKHAIIILLFVFTAGCTEGNETATKQWIKEAKKPIVCKYYGSNEVGAVWTLISADGNVYSTGAVHLSFPDTIKAIP